jgi:hypothetical protein
MQRITAAKIYKNEWFKKGYTPSKLSEKEDVNLDDIDAVFNESKVRSPFSTSLTKQQENVSCHGCVIISHSVGVQFRLGGCWYDYLL